MGDTKSSSTFAGALITSMLRGSERPYSQESLYLFATPKMDVQDFKMPKRPYADSDSAHSILVSAGMIPTPTRTSEVVSGVLEVSVIDPTKDRKGRDMLQELIDLGWPRDNSTD